MDFAAWQKVSPSTLVVGLGLMVTGLVGGILTIVLLARGRLCGLIETEAASKNCRTPQATIEREDA